jgi:hypothetical protein
MTSSMKTLIAFRPCGVWLVFDPHVTHQNDEQGGTNN